MFLNRDVFPVLNTRCSPNHMNAVFLVGVPVTSTRLFSPAEVDGVVDAGDAAGVSVAVMAVTGGATVALMGISCTVWMAPPAPLST